MRWCIMDGSEHKVFLGSVCTTDMHLKQQAANYLNIKDLLDLTCLTVANMIKGYACAVCV